MRILVPRHPDRRAPTIACDWTEGERCIGSVLPQVHVEGGEEPSTYVAILAHERPVFAVYRLDETPHKDL